MSPIYRILRYDWPLHFVLLLTGWLPDNGPFLRLRGALASLFVSRCGAGLKLGRGVTMYNPSKISLGDDVYLAYGCWLMAGAPIVIEDQVMCGPYCVLVSSDHVRKAGSFRHGGARAEEIRVGAGAWMGAHVTVTSGARIGAGCLIGANAVVRGEIEENAVAGGVPAKVIRRHVEIGQQ